MKMTIGKRVIVGFATCVIVTATLGAFAYSRLVGVAKNADVIVGDCMPGIKYAGEIETCMLANNGRLYKHLLAESAQETSQIESAMAKTSALQTEMMKQYEATINDDKDRELFQATTTVRTPYTEARKKALELSSANKKAEARKVIESAVEPAFEKYLAAVEALVRFNQENGSVYGDQITGAVRSGKQGIIGGIGAAVLMCVGLSYVIVRGVNKALWGKKP